MFGKDGLYFLVGCNLAAGYGSKRLVDRLEFLQQGDEFRHGKA